MSHIHFAARLRELRTARGLTQRDVAEGGLSVSYVSLLEAGKRQPTPETVQVLARALSCDVADLLGEIEATQPLELLLAQADLLLETGQAQAARQRYEDVLAGEPDASLRRRATVGLAQALQREGRLGDAAEIYERCVRVGLTEPGSDASLLVVLGWCRCLYELGELVHAAEVGSAALAELDSLEARDTDLAIQLLATVAAVWFELGDLRRADRLLEEGLRRAKAVRSPKARGAILWNASTLAGEKGRYTEALELAGSALAIFRGAHDVRSVGRLLTVRGYFLLRTEPSRAAEALDVLHEALAELDDGGDPIDRGYALTELSYAWLILGDHREAVRAAEQACELLGNGARLEYARALTALAAARGAAGEEVADLFTRAGTELEELGATRHAARTWVEMANALVDLGRTEEALDAYGRATRALNIDDPRRRSLTGTHSPRQVTAQR